MSAFANAKTEASQVGRVGPAPAPGCHAPAAAEPAHSCRRRGHNRLAPVFQTVLGQAPRSAAGLPSPFGFDRAPGLRSPTGQAARGAGELVALQDLLHDTDAADDLMQACLVRALSRGGRCGHRLRGRQRSRQFRRRGDQCLRSDQRRVPGYREQRARSQARDRRPWGLSCGNGFPTQSSGTLLFTAGPDGRGAWTVRPHRSGPRPFAWRCVPAPPWHPPPIRGRWFQFCRASWR